ncbi:MAG: TetR/AcrR family transcriptional regulator [Actinomycetota bacterium]|nr:TetR/AcrR family transcriptional regulator [Actinomycetota bacterium]
MEGAKEHDGRIRRGLRTKEAVVEAFLSLIEDGDPQPTARAIAARAGVSLRSVWQHFEDLETLYLAAGRREMDKVGPLMAPVDHSLPLAARVATFVTRRVEALEVMAPVARAARLREPFSRQLQANRDQLKKRYRDWIEATFAPELEDMTPGEHLDVVEAVLFAGSFSAWSALRDEQALTVERAEGVLGLTVERLIGVGIRP